MNHAPRQMRAGRLAAILSAAGFLVGSLGCGYHLTSKGSNLPAHVKSIGVPEFADSTSRAELGQRISESIIRELISRGKYQVTTETRGVDAVLTGSVTSWTAKPVQLSDEDSTVERVTVTLEASVSFEDRVVRRVTWQQENYKFSKDYDVQGDADEYFDTELSALEDVADDFAKAVVSAILQGF